MIRLTMELDVGTFRTLMNWGLARQFGMQQRGELPI